MHLHLLLHLHLHMHLHLYIHELRGLEGEGAKARSMTNTKFLVDQERDKMGLDLGATSLASNVTSLDKVSYTLSGWI